VDAIETAAGHVFDWIELISVSIFTMEYLLRLWCCVERLTFAVSGPILGRVRYVLTLSSIVDLASFIPYWTQFVIEWFRSGDPFNTDSVSFIAAIRILRVFQLFKANKYVHAIEILKVVFKRNRDILLTTGMQ
jgi:voltage-gated potassium channel